MDARENALRTIGFDRPDHVMQGLPLYGLSYHGCDHEGWEGGGHHLPVGSKWVDIWGTVWHREHDGVMGFPRGCPLRDCGDLAGYAWPDPDDTRLADRIYSQHAEFRGGDVFLCGRHRDTLWEKAYMIAGMENMMAAFLMDPSFARDVLRGIMDFQIGMARHYLPLGIEVAQCGDDLGTQAGPLLSPAIVDDFLMPEYDRLFSLYRAAGVIIQFHSCGRIGWMVGRLLQLGVQVLNPIQATANDLDAIRAATAGKMALEGGVSTQTIMDGPVDAIRAEVRTRIRQLGARGGYFCAPDQGMPFPPEHRAAFDEAVAEFGRYPLPD